MATAVRLYHCFSRTLRDVETILAQRGIVVSYESIRAWGLRFGRAFANVLKRRRHLLTAIHHRAARDRAFQTWRDVAGATLTA